MMSNNPIISYQCEDKSYVIYNQNNNHEIYMGQNEYKVLMLLRGEECEWKEQNLSTVYTPQEMERLVEMLRKSGLVSSPEGQQRQNLWNINKLIIRLDNKKAFYNAVKNKKKFCDILFLLGIPFFLLSGSVNSRVCNIDSILQFWETFNPWNMLCCLVVLLFSLMIHELSHAIYARCIGLHVVGFSVGIDNFIPNMKTVICGIKKLNNKADKVGMYLAGINSNLILAGVGIWLCRIEHPVLRSLGLCICMCNLLIIFMNSFILLNTDGLKVLLVLLELESLSGINMFSIYKISGAKKEYRRIVLFYIILSFFCTSVALIVG